MFRFGIFYFCYGKVFVAQSTCQKTENHEKTNSSLHHCLPVFAIQFM